MLDDIDTNYAVDSASIVQQQGHDTDIDDKDDSVSTGTATSRSSSGLNKLHRKCKATKIVKPSFKYVYVCLQYKQ